MLIATPKFIEFDDVRADLIDEANQLIDKALSESTLSRKPRMIHMCGIPGAGKTTYTNKWIANNKDFVVVQFDTVMEKLSGYQRERSETDLVQSFQNWELPARAIGYHLYQALVENNRNVFFDHSATSKLHIDLIKRTKAVGYAVEMHYIQCAPDEAARRVKEREKIIQRHTPEKLIHERHELLNELLPTYKSLVDRFETIQD